MTKADKHNKRHTSHFETKESILEPFLRGLRYKKILKHIPNNSIVLDAGCGYDSHLLQQIRNRIKEGIGIDLSVAKSTHPKIKLIQTDLDKKLPLKSNYFDVVISMANLEHLHFPERALKEFNRVLKPHGILIITTPTIFNKPILEFLSFYLHLVSAEEIRDHKYYYYKELLIRDLQRAKFKKDNIQISYFQLGLNIFSIAIK